MRSVFIASSLLLSSLCFVCPARAEKVNGRLELGGFLSTENYPNAIAQSTNSDYEFYLFRSYLGVTEMGEDKYEFTSDLRDKYDFFDTLNTSDLKLGPANTFQLYQLNFRKPVLNDSGYGYTLGRTPVPEAGSAFVDGWVGHYRFPSDIDLGWFGGLNPRIAGQPYLDFNTNAYTGGVYLSYVPKVFNWNHNFYLSHAFVEQTANNHLDREYLFHNMSWQWDANSRLITFLYLDFVPDIYVQEGSLYWQQGYTNNSYGKVELLGVNTIEYVHIQNAIDATLMPLSPYSQASYKYDFQSSPLVTWEAGVLYGHRGYDGLNKTEVALSMADQRSFGQNWDTTATVGYRDNFISTDEFARLGLGYFSRRWEWYLSAEYAMRAYNPPAVPPQSPTPTNYDQTQRAYYGDGSNRHALATEIGVSHFWNKELYVTLSFDREADEEVQILSTFFKLGYRYGNREIPPLRDGSPVKGNL